MGKTGKEHDDLGFFRFLFDDKMLINSHPNYLHFYYRIDDCREFLAFNSDIKEFVELLGFGINRKLPGPFWWKDPDYDWKEMEK